MKNEQTKRIAHTAVMIALATVLSMVPIPSLTFGGKVTLFSMVPILFIAFKYGWKWGVATSFIFALIQAGMSIPEILSWGMTPTAVAGCLLLDYIIAYTILGFAPLFSFSKKAPEVAGTAIVMFLRYLSHVLSGIVIFGEFMADEVVALVGSNIFIYSATYNIIFMGIEAVLTVFGIFAIRRFVKNN